MEAFYRTFLVFVVGYLFLRFTGKKAVAQMHTFDLLYILILTNIISTPVEVNNLVKAITYAAITVILYKIFIRLSLHNKLRWIIYESPTVLIQNGDIDREGLKKVRMPLNELLSHLRVKGYTDIQSIAMAVMEETGNLSIIPKSEYRPVQPNDLNLQVKKEFIPIPLIMDGQIIYHNLKYLQIDRGWLINEVENKGELVENITLATLLEDGKLFIDNNEEKEHNSNPYYYKPGRDN
ncbi:uncharacterized membrane protein YcaP (DUF421 family) [Neobacillus bataviensis]|uniref:Uncharacterized membrane protein YcaP (DUF421 family) n=1 Tax=Neobacillus bataviensis TaxID=220685 RepID=A0A561C6J0_9BACI|nr:DUF421 domain-containing protein [Neobacillus bataviensis]TWD86831.1 uncharacterized membrane protein YcaP (DUF421 family) [Neobacillus bataviensis]